MLPNRSKPPMNNDTNSRAVVQFATLRLLDCQLDRQQKSSMSCYREIRFLGLRATYQAGQSADWLLVVVCLKIESPVCRHLSLLI